MVVTTSEGPVVLTAADLTNAAFQTSVANQENGPPFTNSGDFATFDAPRPINYPPGDQYRPVGELYCAPPGDYPQRMTNSDGQFVPYQYKVEPCSTPVPNANHINSPDSGIGDPTLNASKLMKLISIKEFILIQRHFIVSCHHRKIQSF